jgi:PAS domain S-box-containing protein
MPAVIWAVDRDLRFTLSDGGGLAGLDVEPGAVVGLTLFEYFGTEDAEHPPIAAHRRALAGTSATYELDWRGRTFHSRVEPLRDQGGEIVGAVGLAIDITERKLAEQELREAEARYRTLVEQLPAIVYVSGLGQQGQWLYVSPQIRQILGYSPQEWMTRTNPLSAALLPEDRDGVLREEERCRSQGLPFSCEYRVLARDGRTVWIRDEAVPVPQVPELRQGLMFDISSLKRIQETLRRSVDALRATDAHRRELLSSLVAAREEEQRRIAADVHDGPVQKMAAVGLRLEALRQRIRDPGELEVLDEVAEAVEVGTRELRHLLFELAPPILQTEGLAAALRAVLQDLEDEGLRVRLDEHLLSEPEDPTRTVCFRIAQEALRNVRKHAAASNVEVLLASSGGEVHVRIGDDGAGFAPERAARSGHFGVPGMRERAELAGGRLELSTAPGGGTTVEFWIPSLGRSAEDEPSDE